MGKKKTDEELLAAALGEGLAVKGGQSKKNKGGVDFNKGGAAKGTGKSTALTGKKVKGKKAIANYERFKSGAGMDPDEAARLEKAREEKRALDAARKRCCPKRRNRA